MHRIGTRASVATGLALGVALGFGLLPGCGKDSGGANRPDTGTAQSPAHAFQQALGPRAFTFPEDHGPHPGFRDEWWYVTGNLWDREQHRYGFQITLFRRALQPPADGATSGPPADASSMAQAYMGHFAITDVDNGHFIHSERFGRPLAGIAGSGHAPPRVWLDDWRLEWRRDHWRLSARHGAWALELHLEPAFAPILQGDAGYSRKNAQAGNASFYYSQPRLQASGTLERPAHDGCADPTGTALSGDGAAGIQSDAATGACTPHSLRVAGQAWLDREWGSSQLAPEQQGWDWFALQLDDGRALMIYQLHDSTGRADPFSAGSLIAADGRKQALGHGDFQLQPLDHWTSPDGASIPIRWRLQIPAQNIDWQVSSVYPAQYMDGVFRYWEGAVDVSAGAETLGVGYLEMTGYGGDDGAAARADGTR